MTRTSKIIGRLHDPIWPFSFAAFLLLFMFVVVLVGSLVEGKISSSPSPLTIFLGFAAGILALYLAIFKESLSRIRFGKSTVSQSGTLIIRVNKHDLAAIASGMPGYVFYGLTYCIKDILSNPTVVFAGAPSGSLRDGFVFCGKPAHSYNNHGDQLDPPSDMVYMAYVNRSGFLFDWDWVSEDSEKPGYPVDWQIRFKGPLPLPQQATLELSKNVQLSAFNPNNAWYSKEGDCVFWYSSDDPAFAERVNDDLTLFKSLSDRKTTVGAKLKNIQRILAMRKLSLNQLQTKPLMVIIAESLAYQAERGQPISHYDELIGQIQQHHSPLRARVA